MLAQRIRAVRDSRVAEHQAALEALDRGRLFTALVVTSASVANLLVNEFGGSYDVERTHAYLRILTDRQLGLLDPFRKANEPRSPITDGEGSASGAAAFGVREFTQQDSRQWQLQWHHQTGHNPRPEHADADGTTVPAEIGFSVDPGIGAPGCACITEPVNPKAATLPSDMPGIMRSTVQRLNKTYGKEVVNGARVVDFDDVTRYSRLAEADGKLTIELNRAADWSKYWEQTGYRVGEGEGMSSAGGALGQEALASARLSDAFRTALTREYGTALGRKMTAEQWRAFAEEVNAKFGTQILDLTDRRVFYFDTPAGAARLGSERVYALRKEIAAKLSGSAARSVDDLVGEAFAEGTIARSSRFLGEVVKSWMQDNLSVTVAKVTRAARVPKVEVRGSQLETWETPILQERIAKIAQDVYKQLGAGYKSRWKGKISMGEWADPMVIRGDAAAYMDWNGVMGLSLNIASRLIQGTEIGTGGSLPAVKTIVHEIAHAFSKLSGSSYSSGGISVGLEEGLAECFARSYVEKVYGIAFRSAGTSYQRFVSGYERVRVAAGISEVDKLDWYTKLLNMTGPQRVTFIKKIDARSLDWFKGEGG